MGKMLSQNLSSKRTSTTSKTQTNLLCFLLMMALALFMAACTGGGTPPAKGENPGATPPPTPTYTLSLNIDKSSILANNTDSATITGTVLNDKNVPLSDTPVTFSSTGGQISASEVKTDATGEAKVTVKSGPIKTNQTITITASATSTKTISLPINITGTTITLSTDKTNIQTGGKAVLTATLKDAADQPVSGATVNFELTSGNNYLSLSATSGITNSSGQFSIDCTGTGEGSGIITAAALGATATQSYIVASPLTAFGITSPALDPYSLSTNTALPISVTAPGVTTVQFFTSIGTWSNGQTFIEINVANGVATSTLSSTSSGTAIIEVRDKANPLAKNDTMQVNISASPLNAAKIALQASATIVAPSSGESRNSVTLEATVRAANDDVVGNALVQFTISSPSGGGESLAQSSVWTNDFGKATTTFYSGISTDADGVQISATLPEKGVKDTVTIIIGGTAGSVIIGMGSKIEEVDVTKYRMPFSVQVADANGGPIANAKVSLSVWPTHYLLGFWDPNNDYKFTPEPYCVKVGEVVTCTEYEIPNEDINRNLTLDDLEDKGPIVPPYSHNNRFLAGDGKLTPSNTTAGTLPSTVITEGEDGAKLFHLTYLKRYAGWIRVEITASTLVFGTETSATYSTLLPMKEGDEEDLDPSPFGFYPNSMPVANAGSDQEVNTNSLVNLNGGTSTDADGDNLTYFWSIINVAPGSTLIELTNPESSTPTFTPDRDGSYVIQLIVSDGIRVSAADTVTITAKTLAP